MSSEKGYWLQFYRKEVGDIGIDDLPLGPGQDLEAVASNALLSYFNNLTIAPAQRPHHVQVVTHDRFKTVLTLMATGATTVEKV